jgi:CHAD domain-containing protein
VKPDQQETVILLSMTSKADPPQNIAAGTLSGLLRDLVASGRTAVETPDISDAAAVHDLRKALKGWRAMMRLIVPTIGDDAERMRIEARDLAREIAAARDGQAAQEALADLLSEHDDNLPGAPRRARATIEERLAALRTSAEAVSLTTERKAQISEMWTRAGAAIERWPLAKFDRTEAARQLAASYRRVRNAIPEDWSKASPEALHKLRQRVVVHRYQMELAEPLWPKVMRLWVSEAQRLRDRLGSHHDLMILQHLTAPHQPLSRWRSKLAPLITARQAEHVTAAKRLAGRLFAETPKAFLRRLASLWEHRAREAD